MGQGRMEERIQEGKEGRRTEEDESATQLRRERQAEKAAHLSLQPLRQSNSHSSPQSRPEQHYPVRVRNLIRPCAPRAGEDNVDELRDGEDGAVAGDADGELFRQGLVSNLVPGGAGRKGKLTAVTMMNIGLYTS